MSRVHEGVEELLLHDLLTCLNVHRTGSVTAAARELNVTPSQVSKAIASMDESTQQNAALVEQAAAASESIVQQVRELNSSVTGDGDVSKPSPDGARVRRAA